MSQANSVEALLVHGQRLLSIGQHRELFAVTHRLEQLQPSSAEHLDALGALLTRLEEPARALPFFKKAVASAPGQVHYSYNLAMAQRMLGDLEEAERNLDQVISVCPLDGEAHLARWALDAKHANAIISQSLEMYCAGSQASVRGSLPRLPLPRSLRT